MCGRVLTCGAVHLGRDSERFRTSVNATRTATTADLLAGFRAEPLEGLPGQCSDVLEVVIAMELGKPLQLSGRGDDQVDSSGTSVFPEIDVAVAARYYPSFMYICYIHDMSEPVIESMADVRSHLADVIDRARREETPTIITRRGKQEAVVIDIQEYQRLREIAENAEEAWLNRLADEAESEGTEGSVSLEEMARLLRADQG